MLSAARFCQKRASCGSDIIRGSKSSKTAAIASYPPRRAYSVFASDRVMPDPPSVLPRVLRSPFWLGIRGRRLCVLLWRDRDPLLVLDHEHEAAGEEIF